MAKDANTHFFDRYSLVHAAVGALAEVSRIPDAAAIGGHIAFEVVENPVKRAIEPIWPDARPDALQNQVGDTVSFTGGYYAARALAKSDAGKAVVTGFVALGAAIWTWNLVSRHSWKK
jgi:hypothetical protein